MRRKILLPATVLILLVSCIHDRTIHHNARLLTLRVFLNELHSESRTAPFDEDIIKNINLFVTDGKGAVVSRIYENGLPSFFEVELWEDETYSFYAIANYGQALLCRDEQDLMNLQKEVSTAGHPDTGHGGGLMTGKSVDIVCRKGRNINIVLERCYAKINLILNKSRLDQGFNYEIAKIRLCNIPKSVSLFSSNRPGHEEDILPEGPVHLFGKETGPERPSLPATLYMFENLQGDLLPQNRNPRNKIPPADRESRCSFLEISARYTSRTQSGDLIYRIYLGEDNIGNFDIHRNRSYNLTIVPVQDGIDENDWRIDSHLLSEADFSTWSIIPAEDSIVLYQGSTDTLYYRTHPPEAIDFPIQIESDRENSLVCHPVSPDKAILKGGPESGKGLIRLSFQNIPDAPCATVPFVNRKVISSESERLHLTYGIAERINAGYLPFIKGSAVGKIRFNTGGRNVEEIEILDKDAHRAFEWDGNFNLRAKDTVGIFRIRGCITADDGQKYYDTVQVCINTIINVVQELELFETSWNDILQDYLYQFSRMLKYEVHRSNSYLNAEELILPEPIDTHLLIPYNLFQDPIDPQRDFNEYVSLADPFVNVDDGNSSTFRYSCVQIREENAIFRTEDGKPIPALLVSDIHFEKK